MLFLAMLLALCCKGLFCEIIFREPEEVYHIRNREPPDTSLAKFHARDDVDTRNPIVYDLYDPESKLPFHADRVTGELKTSEKLNLKVGDNIELTIIGTNPFSADSARIPVNLRILPALNRHHPKFVLPDHSYIEFPRNASKGYVVWNSAMLDVDDDEVNTAVVYKHANFSRPGMVKFALLTGTISLAAPAEDWTEEPVNVTITACNLEQSTPVLCTTGTFHIRLEMADESYLMSQLSDLNEKKMGMVANAIERMSDTAKQNQKVAQGMANVLSAMMDVDPERLNSSMTVDSSKKLTSSAVEYSLGAEMPANKPDLLIKTDNIKMNMFDMKLGNQSENFDFVIQDAEAIGRFRPIAMFSLPKEVINTVQTEKPGDTARVSFLVYDTPALFKESQRTVIDPVLSPGPDFNATNNATNITTIVPEAPVIVATVKDARKDNLPVPVTFSMKKPAKDLKWKCVFWDEKRFVWSTRGVRMTSETEEDLACEARHMSAFSILFDPTPGQNFEEDQEHHEFALSLISEIGCSLSLFGCICTIFTYAFFRHLHSDKAGKILLNLCVAVGMLNLTFLMGSLLPLLPLPFKIPCAIMPVAIHYFALASFIWMGVEAFNMYSLLVKVFITSAEKRPLLKRALLGWGLPVLVAGCACFLEYFLEGEEKAYMNANGCQLIPTNHMVYYGTFLGPFGLILLFNSVVFVLVVIVLCKPRPGFASAKDNAEKRSVRGAQVHGSLAVMALLGITWAFGLMAVGGARLIFQYIFCVANSLQGFFVFIFRCVERRDARMSWMNYFKTGDRRRRPDISTSGSGVRGTGSSKMDSKSTKRKGSELPSASHYSEAADKAEEEQQHPLLSGKGIDYADTADTTTTTGLTHRLGVNGAELTHRKTSVTFV